MVALDSLIVGLLLLLYPLLPEPTDVIPVLGWIDEGVAFLAGLKLIQNAMGNVSLKDSIGQLTSLLFRK